MNVAPTARANSWADVSDLSASFGVVLDEWQEEVLRSAMGERSDGRWAAKRVGMSVPRQNGKSQLLVARALAGALIFGERKIVVSAHQQDTSRESFSKLLEIIEADGNAKLRARLKPNGIMQALNREAVKFSNGATIQFKARSGAGARGFSSDCLLLDEAQILSQRAWVSINSTMSAMPNPQVWLLGTPPTPEDDGAVFGSVRSSAIEGKSTAAAWIEWAADPSDDPADELTRWSANPAWNTRINHEIVQGEFETYPPDRFALDRLGIWRSDRHDELILPSWFTRGIELDEQPPPTTLGVAVSIDRSWSSIAVCSQGDVPILGANQRRRGVDWVVPEVARIHREHGIPVVIAGRGPGASLIEPLQDAGVELIVASLEDYQDACADLFDRVEVTGEGGPTVAHANHPDLTDAVSAAGWSSHERRVFARKSGEVSMLEAATLALWLSSQSVGFNIW